MKTPLQMYSKIGDLKIIQIKKGKDKQPGLPGFQSSLSKLNHWEKSEPLNSLNTQGSVRSTDYLVFRARPPYLNQKAKKSVPLHHFIGSLNKKLTTGIIISSKINQLRKDGMSFKYFRYNYLLSQDIGKLSKQPLTYEYKFSSNPLLAKKYIKIINGYSFYDLFNSKSLTNLFQFSYFLTKISIKVKLF